MIQLLIFLAATGIIFLIYAAVRAFRPRVFQLVSIEETSGKDLIIKLMIHDYSLTVRGGSTCWYRADSGHMVRDYDLIHWLMATEKCHQWQKDDAR